MGKGKFKGKPPGRRPGHRNFSTPQQMRIALKNATRPPSFKQELAKTKESEEEKVTEGSEKRKGVQGLIEIEKLNIGRPTELSRRERKEIEKQEAHETYMRLCEQGKTEESKKDLERLALLRAQREEAAREREEEKAAQERMKTERAARSQKLATEQSK